MCSMAIQTSLTPRTKKKNKKKNIIITPIPSNSSCVHWFATNIWYSCRNDVTLRRIASSLGWKSSKQNLLRALHIAHAIVVQRSISSFGGLSNMLRVKRKKMLHGLAFSESSHWLVPRIMVVFKLSLFLLKLKIEIENTIVK